MNTNIPSADNIAVDVIQNLTDNPNESGYSADALKEAFDKDALNIKEYLKSLKTALDSKFNGIYSAIYPVGSIYVSVNNTNPSTLFGGTWEQIQDKFLLSAGSTYTAGDTGGAATVTLTTNQIPSHSHNFGRYVPSSGAGFFGDDTDKQGGTAHMKVCANKNNFSNITGTQASGGGQAHNNMPPYLVVYVWKRIS